SAAEQTVELRFVVAHLFDNPADHAHMAVEGPHEVRDGSRAAGTGRAVPMEPDRVELADRAEDVASRTDLLDMQRVVDTGRDASRDFVVDVDEDAVRVAARIDGPGPFVADAEQRVVIDAQRAA